ncbi:unnamed protein product, partial [Callosobruchus maculatus]
MLPVHAAVTETTRLEERVQTDRPTGRPTGRPTDRLTGRPTDRTTEMSDNSVLQPMSSEDATPKRPPHTVPTVARLNRGKYCCMYGV